MTVTKRLEKMTLDELAYVYCRYHGQRGTEKQKANVLKSYDRELFIRVLTPRVKVELAS